MMITLENERVSIGFDTNSGGLTRLFCKDTQTEFLSRDMVFPAAPFLVWTDFHTDYRFQDHVRPGRPDDFAGTRLAPRCASFHRTADTLTVVYRLSAFLTARVEITLDGIRSRWKLALSNQGDAAISLLPAFPCLDGVALPDDARMLGVNQAGAVDRIWHYPGGVYGNAADQSAQLGCLFDHGACLGFYIEDPHFSAKEIRYEKPAVQIRYFPQRLLAPGEMLTLPAAVLLLYHGSWKQTALAYGEWFRSQFVLPAVPEWLRKVDVYRGMWFEKNGKPNSADGIPLGTPLNHFTEMTRHFEETNADLIEYAFFCSLSAADTPLWETNCCGSTRRHTDGLNEIRADLGGMSALKEGVRRVHGIGKKVMLYVEGLIVPEESELFRRIPQAADWLYMNPDGSNDGPYTDNGFRHMCCGCPEWQDHLAATCARLVSETGADGVRLDSFSFYHWPCYHPAHHHASPFDCNQWMLQLLQKVSSAVRRVNPNAVLATEAATDFDRLYMNMALDQYLDPDRIAYGAEDCSVFRVLFPEYYIPRINGGPVFESLLLMPDGCHEMPPLSGKWRAARKWLGEIYTAGRASEVSPEVSGAGAQCRMLVSGQEAVLIGSRPFFETSGSTDSTRVTLIHDRKTTEIRVELPFSPSEIRLFDIEQQTECAPDYSLSGQALTLKTDANWYCVRCRA